MLCKCRSKLIGSNGCRIAYKMASFRVQISAQFASVPWYLGDCDFDNGLCGDWSHDDAGDFQWSLGSGSTPTLNTGPLSDHSGKGMHVLEGLNSFVLD